MAECELLAGCIFFHDKMSDMPNTASHIKKKYCLEENSMCARYVVYQALGKEKVPPDLFPVELTRAHEMIAATG